MLLVDGEAIYTIYIYIYICIYNEGGDNCDDGGGGNGENVVTRKPIFELFSALKNACVCLGVDDF